MRDTVIIPKRLRHDLQWSIFSEDKPDLWVAHDPVNREYYYFSTAEKTISESFDGMSSVETILKNLGPAAASTSVAYVHELLRRLDNSQLLLSSQWQQSDVHRLGTRTSWQSTLQSIFTWRIPIFDPSHGLEQSALIGRVVFSYRITFAMGILFCLCLVLGIQRVPRLRADVMALSWSLQGDRLLGSMILLLLIKILHELAHALACSSIGAKCREIGVLFLLGIPCLYCDVTDIWRIPNRWKRMMVSAAGMYIELIVAMFAFLVWVNTSSGAISALSIQVLVLCSVVTILVNMNPLLRFDGYYILSDWLGIPNLSEQGREAWDSLWKRFLLKQHGQPATRRQLGLALYHIASWFYRWSLLFLLVWSTNRWLFQRRFDGLIFIISAMFVFVLLVHFWSGWYSLVKSRKISTYHGERLVLLGCVALILTWIGGTWSMSNAITTRGIVEHHNSVQVYARRSGLLCKMVDNGSPVGMERPIFVMESPESELELLVAQGELEVASVRYDQLSRRNVDDVKAMQQIVELEETRRGIQIRIEKLLQHQNELQAVSDRPARFFEASIENRSLDLSGRRYGEPRELSQLARDRIAIERGDKIGELVASKAWQIKAFVSENEIGQFKEGAEAQVRLDQLPNQTLSGRVISISETSIEQTPRPLTHDALFISLNPNQPNPKPERTSYSVIIELGTHDRNLVANGLASVRITAQPSTLLIRWLRSLQQSWTWM